MDNPRIINDIGEEIENMNDLESFKLIVEKPEEYLKNIRTQVNFILPKNLIESKEPYIVNIRNDINNYKKLYEREAKQINNIIKQTIESIKKIYPFAENLQNDIKAYTQNYIESVKNMQIPLNNKKIGLIEIKYEKYSPEIQQNFINDRNNILNKIIKFYNDVDEFCNKFSEINTVNCQNIENVIRKLLETPRSVKELSDQMLKSMTDFEKSSKVFKDLSDKEKIDEAFKGFMKPLNKVGEKEKEIQESNLDTIIGEKELENQKKEIQIKKGELDAIINTLKSTSDEISNEIMKIRDKYGEPKPKEKLEQFKSVQSVQIINTQDIENEINIVKEQIKEEIKSINESLNENMIIIKSQLRLDLLFIMDITNSMHIYLEEVKNQIFNIIDEIKKKCAGVEIFSGFIGYKDFSDLEFGEEYINLELTDNYESIEQNIKYLNAEGGGDIPEDLCGALELAKNKTWKGKSRFAILVTDSPCHGKQYYDVKDENYDNYPDGDPQKRNIEDFIKYFAENEISLFCLKINPATDKMFMIFEEIYNKNKNPNSTNQFSAESAQNLKNVVISNAIRTFQNRREMEIKE